MYNNHLNDILDTVLVTQYHKRDVIFLSVFMVIILVISWTGKFGSFWKNWLGRNS